MSSVDEKMKIVEQWDLKDAIHGPYFIEVSGIPELVILHCKDRVNEQSRQNIEIAWKEIVSGTSWSGVKIAVFDGAIDRVMFATSNDCACHAVKYQE